MFKFRKPNTRKIRLQRNKSVFCKNKTLWKFLPEKNDNLTSLANIKWKFWDNLDNKDEYINYTLGVQKYNTYV